MTAPAMTPATTTAEAGRVDTDPTTELPVTVGHPVAAEHSAPSATGSPAASAAPRSTTPRSGAVPWTTLSTTVPRAGEPGAEDSPLRVRRIVVQLGVSVLVVLLAVAVGGVLAAQRLAEREAVNDAANTADVIAEAVVQPSLTNALVAGKPSAVAAFDAVVRRQILGRDVVRVKLWSPAGKVLYADEPQLIGQRFELDQPQLQALANPATHADVSDLDRSENAFEPGDKLLEVYRPVWAPDGTEALFEMYTSYDQVGSRKAQLWRGFAGVVLTSLLLLVILLAPVVWHLLGRIRRAQGQRELLLQRAVDASAEERRRIAASLHDGPVQDLVASSFAVAGAAERAQAAGDTAGARALAEVSGTVRTSIRALRSLLVDIYPPSLGDAGLPAAITDLASTMRREGIDIHVDLDAPGARLDQDQERLIYRVAQECLRNLVRHAGPSTATVSLRREEAAMVLEIVDDGAGFDTATLDARPHGGHFGVRAMADAATAAGAVLRVASAPGAGARWQLMVPTGEARRRD
jgi:two-component system NarL family sensor kinase